MKKTLITIIIAILLAATGYTQTNYHVSTEGNDNNFGLSVVEAWQSIQQAADVLQAGDTVFIKSGIYYKYIIPANSGNAGNYITYTAYPGDEVIIDGNSSTGPGQYLNYSDRGIFDIKDKKYINVIGLVIRNSGNPDFVNPDGGDFHLSKTSPAIDTGTFTDSPDADFDGIISPRGNGLDIGTYEYP